MADLPTLTGVIIRKGLTKVFDELTSAWRNARMDSFIFQLAKELENEVRVEMESSKVDHVIQKMLSDEKYNDLLFESYRKVCLSASKILGPRIIAILTAKIIRDQRLATPSEEKFFLAAEQLSDTDLVWLKNRLTNIDEEEQKKELSRFNDDYRLHFPRVNIPLAAIKLERVGLLYESAQTIDSIGAHRSFNFKKLDMPFIDLIERAQGPT